MKIRVFATNVDKGLSIAVVAGVSAWAVVAHTVAD